MNEPKGYSAQTQMKLVLVVFFFVAALAAPELFDPLSLTGNYVIRGKFYTKSPAGESPASDAFFVLDSAHGQMRLNMGTGGDYWMFADKTYITNIVTLGGLCTTLAWNYTSQVTAYSHAFFYRRDGLDTFWGNMVKDVGSCGYDVSVGFVKTLGVINIWQFGQVFPIPASPAGPATCLHVQGVLDFDLATFDARASSIAALMNPAGLPANCATPYPYCTLAYPPGNACGAPPGV